MFGLGAPLVALVGTNIGAGQRERALRIALTGGTLACALACALTEAVGLVAAIVPMAWLGLFTDDPQMLQTGSAYLPLVGPAYGFFRPGPVPLLRRAGRRAAVLATGRRHDAHGGRGRRRLAGAHRTGLPLDRLPVFGREGHVLPLGRTVQHTGEIDGSDPIDEIIAFGIPRTPPPPGIGALALDCGMLSDAGRVRGFGCTSLAEPGFWRFLA